MAKNSFDDYSITASSNSDVDGLDATGATGFVKSGDNYVRSIMSHAKAKLLDLGASNTVAGTGDAITVTLASNTTAVYDGMRLSINAPGTNTTVVTIAVTNSAATLLGTYKVRKWSAGVETALSAGDITQSQILDLVFDSARDSATGAFMLAVTPAATTFATPTQTVAGLSTTLAVNPLGVSAARLRRNRIPNPANQISTVNGNTSGTTNGYVPADGVAVYRVTSAGTITVQRVQSVTPKGSRDRVRITITAADASLAAGEYLSHSRNLTGNENADLQWGTASAKQIVDRFLFKGPAGTYAVSYKNYNAGTPNRSYVALFTPASANTDEVITIVVPGDTSGTWETGTNPAIVRDIVLACGTTFQGTTGWQAGNFLGTSAVSNGMGTIAQVFEIAEEGLYLDPESTGVPPAWELPSRMLDMKTTLGGDVGRLLAYVNFDGTGTPAIRGSGNVSSITDNGTGDYTVNFTTPMPDTNYNAVVMARATGSAYVIASPQLSGTKTTSAFQITTIQNAADVAVDSTEVGLSFFR